MIFFKSEVVIFSLTFYFLGCTAAQTTSRDATHAGYLYDKPGRTLEVPKTIEEETSTDETSFTRTPTEKPYDEYLPPNSASDNNHSKGGHEQLRQLHDQKRDVQKGKRKFVKQQQFSHQGHRGGGFKQKSGFWYQNKEE